MHCVLTLLAGWFFFPALQFVAAGDFLTFKCPTWSWGTSTQHQESYLPPDKQYLITRAPSEKRCHELDVMLFGTGAAAMDLNEDGFSVIGQGEGECEAAAMDVSGGSDNDDDSDGPIADLDDFDEPNLVEDADPAAAGRDSNIVRTRMYTLLIMFDRYYSCPRIWLMGFDDDQRPLSNKAIYEDIDATHAKKTVTLEHNPYLGIPMLSIHPCKHADVMRSWMARMREGGVEVRPEQSLFLFLKFIAGVIPTIQYDSATSDLGF